MRENTSSDTTNSRNLTSLTSSRNTTTFVQTSTQTLATTTMMTTVSAMIPKRLVRIVLFTVLLIAVAVVYVSLFKHPPPDQLLKMNSRGGKGFNVKTFGDTGMFHASPTKELKVRETEAEDYEDDAKKIENILNMFDDDYEEEKDTSNGNENLENPVRKPAAVEKKGEMKGKAAWDKFVADNGHTVIGIVFDSCDNPREQLGTVVLLPDTENGGVMSRSFYNFTLDRVIDNEGWTFNIDVKYNGQDLYDNWWEVCEMEEEMEEEDRTFQCPIQPGHLSLVKDKHVPGYLPKGRYQSKAWVKDNNNTIVLCGYSDFVL